MTTVAKHETREQWLNAGVNALRARFADNGFPVPTVVRVSVGFPRAARKAIGQCWKRSAAKDGISQVFISPALGDAVDALDTLAHELVHAAIDPFSGHGAKFAKACRALGLTDGKPTSAGAGPELRAELVKIAATLGEYPHAALSPNDTPKQTTRLLKVSCRECGYTARVTQKWLDEAGAPLCPCNSEPMRVARLNKRGGK
jgi:hypothetical protein